ncbi:TetR family transcriptional regulator C-terminal domain-containing protein [Ulvibacter antarcticus]|uniref:Tetracyclin repressor-like C-terminal domain-containing protein n=1 Tax=Ulvibacter antarcticus TaxID=442714 RepID=A0A3L9YE87_9FLAO|nr:TetR family transcriptional regulator C-terminal domain-containing protein [Ulvibacter antarcticus]RMA58694.1 hypothetical protein BXY75_2069 [Ulvibacter antarcticus]
MGRKKKVSDTEIIAFYMEYVIEHDDKPESVEDFAKHYNFQKALFYSSFDSFFNLEQEVFKVLFDTAVEMLEQSGDYADFDKKNKLLSVYFTFFENLSLNREFVKFILDGYGNQWKTFTVLSNLKESFTSYIDSLDLQSLNLNVDSLEQIQKTTIRESSWVQMLLTLKFWMDDTSPAFEKTDILIEKSLNTGLELLDTRSLNNIIDLGKFLYKEKFQSN